MPSQSWVRRIDWTNAISALASARRHTAVTRGPRVALIDLRGIANHANAFRARLGNPRLALAAEHLAHVGIRAIARKALEFLGLGIEPKMALAAQSESQTLSSGSTHTA